MTISTRIDMITSRGDQIIKRVSPDPRYGRLNLTEVTLGAKINKNQYITSRSKLRILEFLFTK